MLAEEEDDDDGEEERRQQTNDDPQAELRRYRAEALGAKFSLNKVKC